MCVVYLIYHVKGFEFFILIYHFQFYIDFTYVILSFPVHLLLLLLLFHISCIVQNHVLEQLNLLWKFVKPISFALIGKEVIFDKLDAKLIGYGVAIVIIACCVSVQICMYQDLGFNFQYSMMNWWWFFECWMLNNIIESKFFEIYLNRFGCFYHMLSFMVPICIGKNDYISQCAAYQKQLFRYTVYDTIQYIYSNSTKDQKQKQKIQFCACFCRLPWRQLHWISYVRII